MWLNICQGLILAGWVCRLVGGIIRAVNGQMERKPSGALGVFIVLVWFFFAGLVAWRAGAVSTILGMP